MIIPLSNGSFMTVFSQVLIIEVEPYLPTEISCRIRVMSLLLRIGQKIV